MDLRHNAQIIELFHIAFLDVLSRRLEQSRYILKGGANLRYFFDSVRYSEDIDLDLNGLAPWSLAEKVDRVLDSAALVMILRAPGISIAETSKPKQTETTRRWKLGLAVEGRDELLRTKIEFSGRDNEEDRFEIEALPRRIVAPYALRAPLIQHYLGEAMSEQKALALARRSQTQARDVFDLDLLLRRYPLPPGAVDAKDLDAAAEHALALPYAAFRDQVLPFLEPEVAEDYDDPEAWDSMQAFVAGELEAK
jgi:predicted nucleotidyltransferase component of viral defense system